MYIGTLFLIEFGSVSKTGKGIIALLKYINLVQIVLVSLYVFLHDKLFPRSKARVILVYCFKDL
jgi:hypothetical protein